MKTNILKVTFNDDGTISVNATGMSGSEKSILAELQDLAGALGGELKVEKHVHGAHSHHHHEGRDHVHE